MKGLLDKGFKYTPSFDTDIRDRFDRIREKLEAEKRRSEEFLRDTKDVVAKIRIKGKVT